MNEKVELKTDRLLLRPFRLEDVDNVYSYAKDPDWAQYYMVTQPYVRRNAEEYVAGRVLADWSTNPTFAMVLHSTVVGAMGLTVTEAHQRAELGYELDKVHWGKGLTTEAATAVVDYGFREYPLEKIFAIADLLNVGSWRVMEKIGMSREGLHRSHSSIRRERRDEVFYGILREEWESGERGD